MTPIDEPLSDEPLSDEPLIDGAILATLEGIVGQGRVLTDADSLLQYGRDWTRAYSPRPAAVVLPSTIEQVQDVVRLAAREQLAIVPSGGRTGLSAGAVARNGELVLALDRLNHIGDFNPVDRTVRCGAGVITADVTLPNDPAPSEPIHERFWLPEQMRQLGRTPGIAGSRGQMTATGR